jgi:hypothetical protein
MNARSFTAVAQKLEILFEGEMDGLDQDSRAKRLLVEDLASLILEQTQILGCQPAA